MTPSRGPTGRRVAWALWPALLVWFGYVGWRAHAELNDDAPVHGLFRTYHPPHPSPVGWVLDPRPERSLVAELRARYQPDQPPPTAADPAPEADPDAARARWSATLDALGLPHAPYTARPDRPWTGAPPRLRITPDGRAYLMLGLFGVDPIVFWPGRGVVRVPVEAEGPGALPPAAHDLALSGASEAPW